MSKPAVTAIRFTVILLCSWINKKHEANSFLTEDRVLMG